MDYLTTELSSLATTVNHLFIEILTRCYERTVVEIPSWFVDGKNRFYWLYLVTFLMLGTWAYRRYYRSVPGGVLSFLFPLKIYRHPSAVLDYKLFFTNRLLGPGGFLSMVLLGSFSITWVATLTQQHLANHFGGHAGAPWTTVSLVIFMIIVAMVRDFSTYATHTLHHAWPLLWEFHKVHHSAEVLTPLTIYRKHPVYTFLSGVTDILIVGPFQGLVAFWFVGSPEPITLLGANVVFTIFHLLGANLRHSHIWMSFGPVLSKILISPAQHQIHHSRAEKHWNKNYGEVFALWDWLFGTLYVPGREREEIEFGIAGATTQEHATLLQAYFVPFKNCGALVLTFFERRTTARA